MGFIQDAAQTPDLRLLCNFLYSVLAEFRNAEKSRCLRAAQPNPSWQAGSLLLRHPAGERGATCCGRKGCLGRAGPAPVRAWAQCPTAAGRCAGRGTARGSRLRVRAHVQGWRGQPRLGPHAACGDRDPRSLWDGAWAVPIKCFRMPAVLCGTEISEASEHVGSSQFLMSLHLI